MMNVKNVITVSLLVWCCTSIFWNCAGQVAPGGGPIDSVPPVVTETYPAATTTEFQDSKLHISFSEWIDKTSVYESIFISPSLGDLEFDWSGPDVDIKFSDTLRSNTTYVLTLGTDVKDLHGVRMAEAFSLAFSTGDHLDSGAIAGTVYDAKAEGIMVFAYLLDGRNADTLNPNKCKPDYLTQIGKEGTFVLPYLRLGRYRLLAIRDEYKNLLYDPQTDQYGIPQSEYTLTAESHLAQGAMIRLTVEDTSAPFLSGARGVDKQHVLLRFSEKIDTSSLLADNISILDTLTGGRLTVINASPSDTSFMEAMLLTGEQDSAKTYRAKVSGIRDLAGNTMSVISKPVDFDGAKTEDTTKPYVTLLNLSNESKNVFPADTFYLGINEWVVHDRAARAFLIQDSAKNLIPVDLRRANTTHFHLSPVSPLQFAMPYTLTIVLDSLIDIVGNHYADSSRIIKFQTIDKERLGGIFGEVVDEKRSTTGALYVAAVPLGTDNRRADRKIEKAGKFSFENLQEGMYVLSAFVDSDSNGVYSYGKTYPFSASERFVFHQDTVKVRARWNVEGVVLRFR